jgi:hypothetical protein
VAHFSCRRPQVVAGDNLGAITGQLGCREPAKGVDAGQLGSALLVELQEGLQVKVASLAGLTILKLFAWGDRRLRDNKDAVDLQTLMRGYGAAGNFDRMTDPWRR